MIVVPLLVGYLVSRGVASPVFHIVESYNAEAFAPTPKQKVEGAHRLQVEEMRLRLEETVGHILPISEIDLFVHLSWEAGELAKEMQEKNKQALVNAVSDSVSGVVFFILLAYMEKGRRVIFDTTNRILSGFSETAKVDAGRRQTAVCLQETAVGVPDHSDSRYPFGIPFGGGMGGAY